MAVGQGSLESVYSFLALGRQTAFATGVTATAQLQVLSASPKFSQPAKVLEEVARNRVHSKRILMGKTIEAESEQYFYAKDTASNWLLQNALGGAITSATSTGETSGGAAFTHTYEIGNIVDQTYTALTMQVRKGDTTSGKVFEYHGLRVNEMTFSAEVDDALKFTTSFMGKDFTSSGTDQASNLSVNAESALNFINGRVSVENSFSSLTSSSFYHVQSMEFSLSNNLKGDTGSRRIGSNTLDVLPAGVASLALNLTLRFDTTTAIDAMAAGTKLAAEFEFQGDTMSGSVIREGIKLQMPALYIDEAGDPEIGGPDEVLTSEITCNVLRDDSSAAGYALQALVSNLTANYN